MRTGCKRLNAIIVRVEDGEVRGLRLKQFVEPVAAASYSDIRLD